MTQQAQPHPQVIVKPEPAPKVRKRNAVPHTLQQTLNVKQSESKISKQKSKVTQINDAPSGLNSSSVNNFNDSFPFAVHATEPDMPNPSRFGPGQAGIHAQRKQQKQISNINHLIRKRYSEKDPVAKQIAFGTHQANQQLAPMNSNLTVQ